MARRHTEDLGATQSIKGFQIGPANEIYSVQPNAGQYDPDCRDRGEQFESLRINIERHIGTKQNQQHRGVDDGQQHGVGDSRKENEPRHIKIGSPRVTSEQVHERKGI
ncbi:MAG: hypothetical protein HOM12_00835 [Proteobacteria bacterium]|nr:hypothetical protein [Gammaproteobacteria bacterium]MBT5226353.1 hypothetical protein [Pseudomonadota bacterium]